MKKSYKLEYAWLLLSVVSIAVVGLDEIARHARFPQTLFGAGLLFCGIVIAVNIMVLGAYSLHVAYTAFRNSK